MDAERLFRDHGHVVLRRAQQILGSAEEAREVLQDIFAGLIAKPGSFGGRSAPTTFLYSVTTHHCLNRLRDRRTRARLLTLRYAGATAQESPRAEHAAVVSQILARMPEELATVMVYYYLDEMSHDEIAEIIGCSRRHIGNLLERARTWLEDDRRVA